jgi:hypothetical protein
MVYATGSKLCFERRSILTGMAMRGHHFFNNALFATLTPLLT